MADPHPTGSPRRRLIACSASLEARAAEASDRTLTSAVVTGRRALAEWQDLAGRLRDLEAECERLARCESKALARMHYVLDLLDKFVEPSGSVSAPIRSGHQAPGGLIPVPRPGPGPETSGSLTVRMLGTFELTIDGQRVTDWRGQRTQSLMQFLTAHRHRSVVRDELIAAVWPDVDEDNGRHRLYQAVYELRRILHVIDPDRSPIVCIDGGYRVGHEIPIWVDVEDFDDLASAASRCFAPTQRCDEAIGSGQQALELYRGDFLCQATGADWATAERNRLRTRFVQLSIHLGESARPARRPGGGASGGGPGAKHGAVERGRHGDRNALSRPRRRPLHGGRLYAPAPRR